MGFSVVIWQGRSVAGHHHALRVDVGTRLPLAGQADKGAPRQIAVHGPFYHSKTTQPQSTVGS